MGWNVNSMLWYVHSIGRNLHSTGWNVKLYVKKFSSFRCAVHQEAVGR